MPGRAATETGPQPAEVPRPLETDEVSRVVLDYQTSARCALEAGFDGVEVHSANHYLLEQFLNNGTNQRTDRYGGSPENRCRFLFEVVEGVCKVWGADRVGVRLSPHHNTPKGWTPGVDAHAPLDKHGDPTSVVCDTEPMVVYDCAVRGLDPFGLAYLHLIEPRWNAAGGDAANAAAMAKPVEFCKRYRSMYHGKIMSASGFTPETAEKCLDDGYADAVAFGRYFISNPDLPQRMKAGMPLNRYDRPTFYFYTEHGYTDYPYYEEVTDKVTETTSNGVTVFSNLHTADGGEWQTFKNQQEGTKAGGSYKEPGAARRMARL